MRIYSRVRSVVSLSLVLARIQDSANVQMLKIKIAKVFFSQKCNVGAGYDAWRRLRDLQVEIFLVPVDCTTVVENGSNPGEYRSTGNREL
jgi:hypothetical protein